MSDGEAEPPWSGPVQRETAQWEREKILHEEKEEGGVAGEAGEQL